MGPEKKSLAIAMLIITVGAGWLLTTLGVGQGIVWVWTLGLAIAGLLTFLISGVDKVSVVVGPFFIVASVLSILRQQSSLPLDMELPILVILAGVLVLVARMKGIPAPKWWYQDDFPSQDEKLR